MALFGVTPQGFVTKTIADIRSSLNAGFRSVFGLAVNVDPRSRNGQLIGIFSEALGEVWQLAEVVANALNPRAATGILLDFICALTGTIRHAAFPSSVNLLLTGVPTTVVPALSRAQVDGTSTKFAISNAATIASAADWVTLHTYVATALVRNGGHIYLCTTGGASASSGGPTGTGSAIADGTCVWQHVGEGTGYVLAPALATVNGPLQGYSASVTIIDTPFSGWSGVFNPFDAKPGALRETDGELRFRRVLEIGAQGSSPLPGLRAKVLRVEGVTTVSVFENVEDATSADGIPAHSFEVLVEGGADADIRAAIFGAKAAGIKAHGTVTGVVSDSLGNNFTIKFTRPTIIIPYVEVTISYDPGVYPADGDTALKQAIVAAGARLLLGRDVVPSLIAAFVLYQVTADGVQVGIPGVLNATVRAHAADDLTTGPLITTPTVLTIRQRASYDTSRITIIETPGIG